MKKKIIKKPKAKTVKKGIESNHKRILQKINSDKLPNYLSIEALKHYQVQIQKIIDEQPPLKNRPKRGLPLKYRRKFCTEIIKSMSQGKDFKTVSAEFGVSYMQLNHWRKIFPEFNYSVKIGKQLSERWWKEVGRLNLFNKNFNHVAWMMNMTNRTDWMSSKSRDEKKIKRIDKKILEVNINDDNERTGKILTILHEAGAIEAATSGIGETSIN